MIEKCALFSCLIVLCIAIEIYTNYDTIMPTIFTKLDDLKKIINDITTTVHEVHSQIQQT